MEIRMAVLNDNDMSEGGVLNLTISVPFSNEEEARIAYESLRVDPEPKRGRCTRTLSQDNNFLIAKFSAAEARHLRVSATSFFDLLILITRTIEQFSI
ncbi:EKC/KEOPS complex subunit LAGE3 [Halyomorpha halys]|uniref:EKC/KEOPS complex subunit LAGE3 n=1 Tax=Halyomorpha halys TaxID=286706 RepID=UPI0006D500C5|nr:uncharacterized protein LOC106684237 [Halyomorpha halys]